MMIRVVIFLIYHSSLTLFIVLCCRGIKAIEAYISISLKKPCRGNFQNTGMHLLKRECSSLLIGVFTEDGLKLKFTEIKKFLPAQQTIMMT